MKTRRIPGLLLTAALLLALVVGGAGAACAETPDVDAQLNVIFSQLDKLRQTDGELTWYYSVTDLNHNGRLEFIAAAKHPKDRSTNLKVWELSSDGTALTACGLAKDEDESFPDILTDTADTYHEPTGDDWYYMFYDNVLISDNEIYTSKSAYRLKDGVIAYMAYAVEHTVVSNGVRDVSHMDSNGIAISPEQYNAAGTNAFAACERSSTNFDWFTAAEMGNLSRLADSYAVFTGRKSPTEVFPVPKPAVLNLPEATPAPAAAPAATPAPVVNTQPVYLSITKNPTNENRNEGGTALFVSCANAYESLSWTLVAPNGGEYSVPSFRSVFGRANVTGEYSTTLSIANVEKNMNNWGAYCTFYYKGQTARTSTAYLYVQETQKSKGAPSGTYTGTVTDWSYNTVTVNVAGQATVSIPWGLCDVDGDLYYGAGASVVWDGKNVTYCYIIGSTPTPQPSYGSMGGTLYRDTAYTVYIVLQNGDGVTVNGGLVNIYGGNEIDGASCTVYYTDYPSAGNIYQVDVYGYESYYEPEYHYDGEYGYETNNYVGVGHYQTHISYNPDGSTYEAIWCPYCGAEVSLAMEHCPVCGRGIW